MRNRASALLILAAASCAAQNAAPAPPSATFHSDALALDFAYPSNFQRPKSAADGGSGADGKSNADAACASVPLAVMDMSEGFNMIFVKAYDPGCQARGRSKTAADTRGEAVDFLTDSLAGFGRPSIGSPVNYMLAGHDASTVFGHVKLARGSGTTEIYGVVGCAVAGKNVACFEFLSDDCHKIAVLAASTVKFTGAAATPVLAARLVPPCKP